MYHKLAREEEARREEQRWYKKYPLGYCPLREECQAYQNGEILLQDKTISLDSPILGMDSWREDKCLNVLGKYLGCRTFWTMKKEEERRKRGKEEE